MNLLNVFKRKKDVWAVVEKRYTGARFGEFTKYVPTKNGHTIRLCADGTIIGGWRHYYIDFDTFEKAEQFIKDVKSGKIGVKRETIIP